MPSFPKTTLMIGAGLFCTATSALADKNSYTAPHALVAPSIDGVADKVWDHAAWDSINVNWEGTAPTPTDFSGRYKVMWDSAGIYLLVEIVDDSVSDVYPDPLTHYWDDDAVEIFLDENHNGGNHQYNFSAWAYHISTKYDVVDFGTDQQPHLFNDHFLVKRVQSGHTSLWEMRMSVYGETYQMGATNTPLKLAAKKDMGFSLAYCDNDGGAARKHFMGSVNTAGHLANQGYLNAGCFGTLILSGDTSTTSVAPSIRPESLHPNLQCTPQGFRNTSSQPTTISVLRPDGTRIESFQTQPGRWYGASYPMGTYLLESQGPEGMERIGFTKAR